MPKTRSLPFALAALALAACGGSSSDSTAPPAGPAFPAWSTVGGVATEHVPVLLPNHAVPASRPLRAQWVDPSGTPSDGTAQALSPRVLALRVPEVAAGVYDVRLFDGTRLVAGGQVVHGGVPPVSDPAATALAGIERVEGYLSAARAEVALGALPNDLGAFLTEAELRIADARAELGAASAAEVSALAAALEANAARLQVLQAPAGASAPVAGCATRSDREGLDTLVAAPGVFVDALASAALGLDLYAGSPSAAGVSFGSALGLAALIRARHELAQVLAAPAVALGVQRACGYSYGPLTVATQVPFEVPITGECRTLEAADALSSAPRLASTAVEIQGALVFVEAFNADVAAALAMPPASVPATPPLAASGAIAEVRMDPAHVVWATAAEIGGAPVPVTFAPGTSSRLSLSLGGGTPGERVVVTYGFEQPGFTGVTVHQVAVTLAWPLLEIPRFATFQPGTFTMGSSAPAGPPHFGEYAQEPQRQVTLTYPFWIGQYEVRQSEFLALMGFNYSYHSLPPRPVEQVTWDEALAYCRALTAAEAGTGRIPPGYEYRLPTEAEWEYAARAGAVTEFHTGDILRCVEARIVEGTMVTSVEICPTLPYSVTAPVGLYVPNNAWMFDVHGNVSEWCLDSPSATTTEPVTNPLSLGGDLRIMKGGSYRESAYLCRFGVRMTMEHHRRGSNLGFRVVLGPIIEL